MDSFGPPSPSVPNIGSCRLGIREISLIQKSIQKSLRRENYQHHPSSTKTLYYLRNIQSSTGSFSAYKSLLLEHLLGVTMVHFPYHPHPKDP